MKRHSQQGSALLIVLGFLSFMVVSAVAFAIWMRTERMPSSALRRTVANNYLVKAAVAQAMSRVDDAIRSHTFPGVYTNQPNSAYRDGHNCIYDWWEARVFMPPDPEGKETKSGDPNSRYAPVTKTVSVLSLEALGYLPPAIANDVRLLSRSSWAAQWDYFNFDAGRYAFCAVNVSDFLDITKIAADSPRTSAAAAHAQQGDDKPKPSRFSLAYLFRNSRETERNGFSGADFSRPSGMNQFDQCVHTAPGSGQWTTAPLVSMMDYNLSVGPDSMGPLWSPFFKLINGDNTRTYFYGATGSDNIYVKGAERQPFVTSSWFPQNELAKSDGSASTPLDISQNPPFTPSLLEDENVSLSQVLADSSPREFWKSAYQYGHALCILDQFTLFDYLDKNDMPLSLAMPCAERVPMLTALAPVGNLQVVFTPMERTGEPVKSGGEWIETSEAKIKITANGLGLSSTLLFPFSGGKPPDGYTAQAFARLVFVASGAAGGGAASSSVSLRSNGFAKNLRPSSREEWTDGVDSERQFALTTGSGGGALARTPVQDCMVVTFPSQGNTSWTPPANMQNEHNAWKDALLQLRSAGTLEKPILRRVDVYNLSGSGETQTRGTKKQTYYEVLLKPFDENGEVLDIAGQYPDGKIPDSTFAAFSAQYTMRPYLVTWARVMQQDGKTVDMVPAAYEDDRALNDVDNAAFSYPDINNFFLGNTTSDLSGERALPIMRFQNSMTFTFADVSSASAPAGSEWVEKSCYTVDPRFNWAPENWWFDKAEANPTGQKWYDAVFGNGPDDNNAILNKLVQDEYGGGCKRGDRAADPFLFVSNLGYLQSVGELAFLPHLSDMREDGYPSSVLGDSKGATDSGSHSGALYNGQPRDLATVTTMPCALAAWKSYQNYRTNPNQNTFEFGANLYRRGLVNPSQGFYVNPFTQSQEVMLAALANAPLNYWVAGTNYTAVGKTQMTTFDSYKSSMFSDNSPGVQLKGKDLNKIAMFLRRRFEDLASMIEAPQPMGEEDMYVYQKVWEDMFDALDWGGTMNCTVGQIYDDLENYYNSGESNSGNYRKLYMQGNGYSSLNHFVRGGGRKVFNTRVSLKKEKAVHWNEDRGLSADPFRGQYSGDTGATECWNQLFDVDRKFLHSYWRDCFANRQQLFLIFVRAESTALGGTGEGTPAQQGGRAVALVWRDPLPPTGEDVFEHDNNQYQPLRHPHKMRILFYRQFD